MERKRFKEEIVRTRMNLLGLTGSIQTLAEVATRAHAVGDDQGFSSMSYHDKPTAALKEEKKLNRVFPNDFPENEDEEEAGDTMILPMNNKFQNFALSRTSRQSTASKRSSRLDEIIKPLYDHRHRYKTEPARIFSEVTAKQIIEEVLKANFTGVVYKADTFRALTKATSNIIRQRVKQLDYARYKIISFVYAGENLNQDIRILSMALLSSKFDRCTEYAMDEKGFYVVGVVYALYSE